MPYMITKRCEKTDYACIEACPFDCIQLKASSPRRKSRLYVDTELCTNCGACALACPENLFAPMTDVGPAIRAVAGTAKRRGRTVPNQQKENNIDVSVHSIISVPPASAVHHVH